MMKRLLSVALLIFFTASGIAQAQGLLVVTDPNQRARLPRPSLRRIVQQPTSYRIKELTVRAKLLDQVGRVQVTQSFVNTGSRQLEARFIFPLPYDGAIDSLTLLVDGKEYPAQLLAAKEARRIYEGIVRKNKDPALLEWIGTGMFQTSVFPVPPGAERKVTLTYSQLLRKDHQLTDFLFPLSTAKYTSQPPETIDFRITIESSIDIKNVYSPTYPVTIQRPDSRHAIVQFTAHNQIPGSDFRLFYDVAKGQLGTSLISYRPSAKEDGYFLLLTSPQIKPKDSKRMPKAVLFVIDHSGSMQGKKIEQARDALKHVLNNLREGDQFNIVSYESSVETFRPQLQTYNDETRKAALGFVEGIYAGGGTNIHGSLQAAMQQMNETSLPKYLIFLTDGLPTVGIVDESKIVNDISKLNHSKVRMINFGVGFDVNSRLLDRLARRNFGQSEYVRPNEDIEVYVSRLYNKISSPVMTDVAVNFDFDNISSEQGNPINRVYPRQVNDLFEGEQLVIVGRYRQPGRAKVKVTGSIGRSQQKLDFPVDFAVHSHDASYAFVEKLWAMRRIGEIIDELDLKGNNNELVKELVALSTKHGILTPYTSFLADENSRMAALQSDESSLGQVQLGLRKLSESSGRQGFVQREAKRRFQDAAQAPQSSAIEGFSIGGSLGGAAETRDIESDKAIRARGLVNIGKDTLYRRGKQWVTSKTAKLDLKKDAEKIQVVERFSKEYFDLTRKNTKSENQLLGLQKDDEELLVEFRGQVYWIK